MKLQKELLRVAMLKMPINKIKLRLFERYAYKKLMVLKSKRDSDKKSLILKLKLNNITEDEYNPLLNSINRIYKDKVNELKLEYTYLFNEIDELVSGIRNENANLNRWVDKQELKLYFDTCDTYLKMHRDNGTFKKSMIKTNLNSKNAKVYYHLGKCLKVLNNLKNK